MQKPSVYGIIPARGGSKGVPKKNIKPLAGYPLIAYSILCGRECATLDRVIVSTDSEEIAEVSRAFGGEVPFMRPAEFAADRSPDDDVIRHAIDWCEQNEGGAPDFWVYLRPTTPLRVASVVDDSVRAIIERDDATSLCGAHELPEPPQKMMRIREEDGFFDGFFPDDPRPEYFNLPRQLFPKAYLGNGYMDIYRTSFVKEGKGLLGPRILSFVTPDTAEVDTPDDFAYIEYLVDRHGSPLLDTLRKQYPDYAK